MPAWLNEKNTADREPEKSSSSPSARVYTLHARHIIVHGRVQGVGFRYFTLRTASRLGLTGWVRNLPNGNVEVWAEGTGQALDSLEQSLEQGPPMSSVYSIESGQAEAKGIYRTFDCY